VTDRPQAEPAVLVPALLAAAGLSPSPEEVAVLVAQHPRTLADLEALHAVPAARYEEPGVVFRARP
jgi:hypothetical protein